MDLLSKVESKKVEYIEEGSVKVVSQQGQGGERNEEMLVKELQAHQMSKSRDRMYRVEDDSGVNNTVLKTGNLQSRFEVLLLRTRKVDMRG